MLAAVAALRKLKAGRIVVAAPTIARATYDQIGNAADDVAAVVVPKEFYGVVQWFKDLSQTTDEEVRELLAQADQRVPSVSP
jgi:putative phosphoribosyl transferase